MRLLHQRTPKHDQLSNVKSSSNRLGGSLEETAMGSKNLQTKRITIIWRDRLEDCSPLSASRPNNRKRKAKANLKVNCDNSWWPW
ncbi:hypothetical protein RHGRI_001266 [Rhododendron griersonianum]|uniref:Uncharacterized protein n=1 Tax=Rhododendron griersonianum TaxID=479676 RepID=A0AAV6LKR6_9ERIC|nr:hypothetical protein RHGRI_001266 [Rhododendron griersonianum]